jgi:hypothetical protein
MKLAKKGWRGSLGHPTTALVHVDILARMRATAAALRKDSSSLLTAD